MAEVDLDKALEVAKKLALEAGELIKAANLKPKKLESKSTLDFVTETDKACEALILSGLKAAFPTHQFIGEETTGDEAKLGEDPTWMVDPLDGTTNFLHGFPYVSVSIGLVVKKRSVLGVVHAPLLNNELYTAIRGRGAFRNGTEKLSVTNNTELNTALMATGFPKYREHLNFKISFLHRALSQNLQALRSNGSAALDLCGVASGRLDAYVECTGICCWDVCAGSVIAEEAGAVAVDPLAETLQDFDLMARRILVANSPKLAQSILALFQQRDLPSDTGSAPSY